MSKKSIIKNSSKTDWEYVKTLLDKDIDISDIPEVSENHIVNARLRFSGKPLSKGKVRVNIFLDSNVVAYFKTAAGGRGYQTLINKTLKESIVRRDFESTLRKVIREELQAK